MMNTTLSNDDYGRMLSETAMMVDAICTRVSTAGLESSLNEGAYHHEIAYGIATPFKSAADYWRAKADAFKATSEQAIPVPALQKLHREATEATGMDLEGSIRYFGRALTSRRGQRLTEEDEQAFAPMYKATDLLEHSFNVMEGKYDFD